ESTSSLVARESLAIASIVVVDINPSVKLMLDSNDVVIHVHALNEDAETLSLESIMGMKVEDAVESIVALAKSAGFINNDNLDEDYILITTIPAKGKIYKSEDLIEVELDDVDETSSEITEDEVKQMNQLKSRIEEKIENSSELQKVNVAVIKATKVEMRLAEEKHVPVGLYVVRGKIQVGNEQISVRDYFSNKENVDQFKETGSVFEKRDAAKMDLARRFIDKLDAAGADTTLFKTELENENVDIEQLLIKIKALWSSYDLEDDDEDEADDSINGKPDNVGKPVGVGRPENVGKPEFPGNSPKGNNGKQN
ncbi:MAG TPA: hypothetical protein DCS67_06290, partial [Clostridiales bacterium UBA8960]|nr:hypothetical protein [Clostridiales bacterium UBA8960]